MLEGRNGVTQVVSCLDAPELYARGSFMGGSSLIPHLILHFACSCVCAGVVFILDGCLLKWMPGQSKCSLSGTYTADT